MHAQAVTRPKLRNIVRHVYIPKMNVKRYSPYLYAGEKSADYFNMRYFQTSNRSSKVKLGEKEQTQRLILGVESSFDDSCAGIVSSCGQVLANEKMMFDDNVRGEDAPLRAKLHHEKNLPIVVK